MSATNPFQSLPFDMPWPPCKRVRQEELLHSIAEVEVPPLYRRQIAKAWRKKTGRSDEPDLITVLYRWRSMTVERRKNGGFHHSSQ